jgi:hypothetical protein
VDCRIEIADVRTAAVPAEVKDDFVFSSDALLQQVIAQSEVRFGGHGAASHASASSTAVHSTQPVSQNHSPEHQLRRASKTTKGRDTVGAELFSPESRQLLDLIDSINDTDVTQPAGADGSSELTAVPSVQSTTLGTGQQQKVRPRAARGAVVDSHAAPVPSAVQEATLMQQQQDEGSLQDPEPATAPLVPAAPPSPKIIISHRRARVRPNVEYVGQYPASTVITAMEPRSEHPSTAHVTYNTQFSVPSSAAPRAPQSDRSNRAAETATDLDAAIEQASLLNIQNILSRRPSNSTMPMRPYLPEDGSSVTYSRSSLGQEPSDWEMEHTHTELRRGSDHLTFAMDAEAILGRHTASQSNYPHTEQNQAWPDLRRSFEPTTAARKSNRNQVDNKHWYSYDEGTAGAGAEKNKHNDMWFLFLKQKRQAQQSSGDEGHGARTKAARGRPQRPQSSTAPRPALHHFDTRTAHVESRTTRDYAASLREYGPPSAEVDSRSTSPRRKEWSFDEPARHHEQRARPSSAGPRLRSTTDKAAGREQGYEARNYPGVPAVRPSLSDALAEALQGLAGFTGDDTVSQPQSSLAAATQNRDYSPSAAHAGDTAARARRHPSSGKKGASSSGSGTYTRKARHKEVKERLVKTYAT